MVIVDLLAATICFLGSCYPALTGTSTPQGVFQIERVATSSPGYGGDVLLFHESADAVFAIHRVWLLNPSERRAERLQSRDARSRNVITNGCVNVAPEVYDRLVECCGDGRVTVVKGDRQAVPVW